MPAAQTPWWQRWWRGGAAAAGRLAGGDASLGAAPAAAAALAAGSTPRVGPYRVLGVLGQGASGPVYLAQADGAPVALKLWTPPASLAAAARADQRERFVRQTQVMRALSHPDIVAVVASGEHAGAPWIAMELAPGADLARYTRAPRLLPEPVALDIAARVADALAHAHARGVVHRDLKPANVRIDLPGGRVKLMDFGVARVVDGSVTRTGVTLGTPAYMAPEQLAGDVADARSDTYALGVVLYELLTGRLPYPAASLGELLRAVAAGDPTPLGHWRPGAPPALQALLQRMLARDPAHRPADLGGLADELRRCGASLRQTRDA